MGEYSFGGEIDARDGATAQMPIVDGYRNGSGNAATEQVTRRRAVTTAIVCAAIAFISGIAAQQAAEGKPNDYAKLNSRYQSISEQLSVAKNNATQLNQKLDEANNTKTEAESKVQGLENQVSSLTSERDSCRSELATAASNATAREGSTQSRANGSASGVAGSGSGQAPGSSVTQKPESSQYYENCDAARAAGVAPLRAGEQGYRAGLDRDRDGIACE